jgi:hypothetical protein
VNMISTIHNSSMVDLTVGKGGVRKKPISISEYNMFMKGVNKADQYLAYYSLLRNSNINKESCIVAYQLCPFQFVCHL